MDKALYIHRRGCLLNSKVNFFWYLDFDNATLFKYRENSWKYLVARMVEQYNFNTVLSDYM